MTPPVLDVAVVGAGLAGNLFARQIRCALPHLRVGLFERSGTTSFKVGESAVDLFSNYMIRRLGLSNYLYSNQLPKNGLRFFFDSPGRDAELPAMSEIGTVTFPFHPSFQLDRARFEADLQALNRQDGVEINPSTKVEHIRLGRFGGERHPHRFVARNDTATTERRCRWLIDATGRASVLARQENLRISELDHELVAAWARFRGVADLDTFGPQTFRRRIRYSSRMLSTVHFCYRGYWIWFIPLGRGVTSVGVVGERQMRSLDACRRQDDLLRFLAGHRAVSSLLASAELLDFGSYRQLAYGTRRYFSGDGWGLIGEAAAFSDPFYSPGSDFIALENDLLTDLVRRDHAGESPRTLQGLAELYSRYLSFRHEASMRLYRGLYPTLGSYQLFRLKWRLDIALYYHMWLSQFLQDLHLDPEFLRRELTGAHLVLNTLSNFSALFQAVEQRLQRTQRYHRLNLGQFAEPLDGIEFVREVGAPISRRDDLKRQAEIFNAIRLEALDLLEDDAGGIPRIPIALSQFVAREPLVAISPASGGDPLATDIDVTGLK